MYYALPGLLIMTNGGRFTWARWYSDADLFTATLGLAVLALVAFLLGGSIAGRLLGARPLTVPGAGGHKRRDSIALALVLIGLMLKIYLIASAGGLDQTVLRLSAGIRQSEGLDAFSTTAIAVRTLSGVAEAGATWLVVSRIARRAEHPAEPAPLKWPVILFVIVTMISFVTTGKRLTLLVPILAVALAIHYFRRPLSIRLAPVMFAGVFAFGMLSLFFRVFVPAALANVRIDLAEVDYARGSLLNFYAYSLEFSTVDMTAVTIHSREKLQGLFGGGWEMFVTTNFEPLAYGVPRALLPWKPDGFYDVSYGLSAILTGTSLEGSSAGYVSTAVGTSYAFAGMLGTVVTFAIFGFICSRIDSGMAKRVPSPKMVIVAALTLNLTFHFFRQGTIGWTFIIGVVQQYGFILGCLILFAGSARAVHKPRVAHGTSYATKAKLRGNPAEVGTDL